MAAASSVGSLKTVGYVVDSRFEGIKEIKWKLWVDRFVKDFERKHSINMVNLTNTTYKQASTMSSVKLTMESLQRPAELQDCAALDKVMDSTFTSCVGISKHQQIRMPDSAIQRHQSVCTLPLLAFIPSKWGLNTSRKLINPDTLLSCIFPRMVVVVVDTKHPKGVKIRKPAWFPRDGVGNNGRDPDMTAHLKHLMENGVEPYYDGDIPVIFEEIMSNHAIWLGSASDDDERKFLDDFIQVYKPQKQTTLLRCEIMHHLRGILRRNRTRVEMPIFCDQEESSSDDESSDDESSDDEPLLPVQLAPSSKKAPALSAAAATASSKKAPALSAAATTTSSKKAPAHSGPASRLTLEAAATSSNSPLLAEWKSAVVEIPTLTGSTFTRLNQLLKALGETHRKQWKPYTLQPHQRKQLFTMLLACGVGGVESSVIWSQLIKKWHESSNLSETLEQTAPLFQPADQPTETITQAAMKFYCDVVQPMWEVKAPTCSVDHILPTIIQTSDATWSPLASACLVAQMVSEGVKSLEVINVEGDETLGRRFLASRAMFAMRYPKDRDVLTLTNNQEAFLRVKDSKNIRSDIGLQTVAFALGMNWTQYETVQRRLLSSSYEFGNHPFKAQYKDPSVLNQREMKDEMLNALVKTFQISSVQPLMNEPDQAAQDASCLEIRTAVQGLSYVPQVVFWGIARNVRELAHILTSLQMDTKGAELQLVLRQIHAAWFHSKSLASGVQQPAKLLMRLHACLAPGEKSMHELALQNGRLYGRMKRLTSDLKFSLTDLKSRLTDVKNERREIKKFVSILEKVKQRLTSRTLFDPITGEAWSDADADADAEEITKHVEAFFINHYVALLEDATFQTDVLHDQPLTMVLASDTPGRQWNPAQVTKAFMNNSAALIECRSLLSAWVHAYAAQKLDTASNLPSNIRALLSSLAVQQLLTSTIDSAVATSAAALHESASVATSAVATSAAALHESASVATSAPALHESASVATSAPALHESASVATSAPASSNNRTTPIASSFKRGMRTRSQSRSPSPKRPLGKQKVGSW